MKYFSLIIFFLFSCLVSVFAQVHAFQENTNIVFYPVSKPVIEDCRGYDCFYDTNKAYKKGKLNLRPKYRFCVNTELLTSFEEITNHVFHVDKTQKIVYKKVPYYCAFLTRSDGRKLTLAIPFFKSKKTTANKITRAMIRRNYNKSFEYSYGMDIPFIEINELEFAIESFEGTDIIRYSVDQKRISERMDVLTYIKGRSKENHIWSTATRKEMFNDRIERLNSSRISTICSPGCIVHGEKIEWHYSPLCTFEQPCLRVRWYGQSYYLPIKDIYGYSNEGADVDYHNCELSDFYLPYNEISSKFKRPEGAPKLNKGDKFFFNYHDNYEIAKIKGSRYPYVYPNEELIRDYYKYEKEGVYPAYSEKDIKYSVLLISSKNDSIVLPYSDFQKAFISEKEVNSIIAYNKRIERERIIRERKDIADIGSKYGNEYSKYYAKLSESDKTKFKNAASKWGAKDAKDIVEGYVQIGWSKEKCRMSWGAPRDINKTITSWGTHEQWCYRSSYLYFDDGVLTTIQN